MLLAWGGAGACAWAVAEPAPQFTAIARLDNGDVRFQINVPAGQRYRIETSSDLREWQTLLTAAGTGTHEHTDAAALAHASRYFRARMLADATALTGDHVVTTSGDVVIHPINHASLVLQWDGKMIYNDPVGGAAPYQGLPRADLILVSHDHGDHFDAATLNLVRGENAVIVAPQAVFNSLSATLRAQTVVLTNGATTNILGVSIEAVPAYNANHSRGRGNGYVLGLGGKRLYLSGDTGNIAEMRALENIDVAFVCMNVPFTMTVAEAATAVRAFQPRIVYPYHYRNQGGTFADLDDFRRRVGTDLGVEVRVRAWY